MAFDDLDRAEQEEAAATADATADATESEPSGEQTPASEPDARRRSDAADSVPNDAARATDGPSATATMRAEATDPSDPAFGFEEAKQRPLYARQAAWDAFEDALAIEVEATLRRNDVRDTPKRELHDAALHVLAEHADEVAERVLEERGLDG